MSDENIVVQGPPWTSVRYFSTFEEANALRTSLKKADLSGTLEVKVKRCGVAGVLYSVKTRQSAELAAAAQSVDEGLEAKPVKKARKAKK